MASARVNDWGGETFQREVSSMGSAQTEVKGPNKFGTPNPEPE